LLIQQNPDPSDVFNRSWAEFKAGFNDSRGNYWLGNDLLSQLTLTGRYKRRMVLQPCQSLISNLYIADTAEYSTFIVQPEWSNYRLNVSGYSGNTPYDVLLSDQYYQYVNRQTFTTFDRDNDHWSSGNCAAELGAGFWYNACIGFSMNNCHYNKIYRHDMPIPVGDKQLSSMLLHCK